MQLRSGSSCSFSYWLLVVLRLTRIIRQLAVYFLPRRENVGRKSDKSRQNRSLPRHIKVCYLSSKLGNRCCCRFEPITALFSTIALVQGPSFANSGGKSVNFCKISIEPALAHSAAAPCRTSSSQTRFTPGE